MVTLAIDAVDAVDVEASDGDLTLDEVDDFDGDLA
jgi:hypothetical protein